MIFDCPVVRNSNVTGGDRQSGNRQIDKSTIDNVLDSSEQEQDQHDDQDQPESAAWCVAPVATVGPPGNGTQHEQNQNYQQD
jgi:hypothetical protein